MDDNKKTKIQILPYIPLLISIIHLIGILIFQNSIKLNINKIENITSISSLFGISQFSFSLLLNNDLQQIKIIVGLTTIVIALLMVFLNYFTLKKYYFLQLITLSLYSIDFIFSIIALIILLNNSVSINLALYIIFFIIRIIAIILIVIPFVQYIKYNNNVKEE